MKDAARPHIVGLPSPFEISREAVCRLDVDNIVRDVSLELGIFSAYQALCEAAAVAYDKKDHPAADALQLLVSMAAFSLSDDPRHPFIRLGSGHYADGSVWQTALPEDLEDSHVAVLVTFLDVIKTPVLRARLGDVLWVRMRPRDRRHAQIAIDAYLSVADATFSPEDWTTSEDHFQRAFRLAASLGTQTEEFKRVLAAARGLLDRLYDNDPRYYTERILSTIVSAVSDEKELREFLNRALAIAASSETALHDFERARTYYDVAIRICGRLGDVAQAKRLRLQRAESFVSQALLRPTEMLRSMDLREGLQQLRQAGATRERIEEVALLLDDAQMLSISEMSAVAEPLTLGDVPERVRRLLSGCDPIEGLWTLAGLGAITSYDTVRSLAESSLARHHFAFGFARRHLASDGRQEGATPGALGAEGDAREEAVLGAMRFHAQRSRLMAAFSIVEPGIAQLTEDHTYTISDLLLALQGRRFIPGGHHILWAKAIHAGLLGEFDVAIHILAPQLENALREALRRRIGIVYSTSPSGVQSLMSIEKVLEHPVTEEIFGKDLVFALDTALAERLGANTRNIVAHGIANDSFSQSYESAFIWFLTLRILRFYGEDALKSQQTVKTVNVANGPDDADTSASAPDATNDGSESAADAS